LTKRESPKPKPNATLSQEGLLPPELDTNLQYKEAHLKKPSSTQLTNQVPLNTEVTALAHLSVRLWMTQNPTKPSATQLTNQVPLNTEVTALAHLPVRLWMTQNLTKSSVSQLTVQVPLTTEVTNPVSTENHKGNSTIIFQGTMIPGKVYGG
jgi:hypothetical protein